MDLLLGSRNSMCIVSLFSSQTDLGSFALPLLSSVCLFSRLQAFYFVTSLCRTPMSSAVAACLDIYLHLLTLRPDPPSVFHLTSFSFLELLYPIPLFTHT